MTRTGSDFTPCTGAVLFIFSPVVFRAGGELQTWVALLPVLLAPSDDQRPGPPQAVRGWAPLAGLEQVSPALGLNFPSLGQGHGGPDLPSSPGLEGTSPKMLSQGWGPGVQSEEPQPGPRASSALGVGGGCVGKAHRPSVTRSPVNSRTRLYVGGSSGCWYKAGSPEALALEVWGTGSLDVVGARPDADSSSSS